MSKTCILFLIVIILVFSIGYIPTMSLATSETEPYITYSLHLQDVGWEKDFIHKNGKMAGFIDTDLKIEAIKIKLNNVSTNVLLSYRVHVENEGWLPYVSNGNSAGTTGKNLKMEAIQIKLEGLDEYDIMYRAYVEGIGWQGWVINNEIAGTTGQNKKMYAIQIKIRPKVNLGVNYYSYVEGQGWEDEYCNYDGQESGTTGQNLKLEAIKIKLKNAPDKIEVNYQSHIQNEGWQEWKKEGEISGIEGQGLKVEAIKIRLVGNTEGYSIQYRVHVQDIGWQDWVSDGIEAGTIGKNLKIEAVQIRIIESNMPYIAYSSHIQDIGWEKDFSKIDGTESGIIGEILKLEAIEIKIEGANSDNVNIKYQSYIQNIGWQEWKKNGEISGTTGKNLRLEAIKIELEGLNGFAVKYRVHLQDRGWQKWMASGTTAGIANSGIKIEAIQILIISEDEVTEDMLREESLIKNGIDISVYQGTIDWTKVAKDTNVNFVIIRAGFRGYGAAGTLVTDSKFKTNIEGALRNGIDVGVYFFSQAVNEKEAIEEARYTLNLLKNYKITYPIIIDTEQSSHPLGQGRADNLSREQRTKVVDAFCKTVKEAGYEPMIYANKWWLTEKLDMSKLSHYSVWLAHYTGATQENPLLKPSDYKGEYVMWQYTDKGIISGISGNVDMDIMNNK